MKTIKKEFLDNYRLLDLNINATTVGDVANNNDEYLFIPININEHKSLINTLIRISNKRNKEYLLPKWSTKPATDEELINTAKTYLEVQFINSKNNIKNEISLTGEQEANARYAQLLKTYLPILVLYITYVDEIVDGLHKLYSYLSWDDDTLFLPLPYDEELSGIDWDSIYNVTEDAQFIANETPTAYDTQDIKELLEHIYEKLCTKIDHKTDELKNFITTYISKNISDNNDVEEDNEYIEKEAVVEDETTNREDNSEEYKELLKENEELKEANEKLEKLIKKLEDKLSLVKHDNDDLMKRNSEHDAVVEEFQEEISNLKQEIESLNLELENKTSSGNEETSAIIGVKDNEIAELKRELETRKETEQLLRDRNAELEEADNTLRKELNKISEENTQLTKKLSDAQAEIVDYIDVNRQLERTNDSLTVANKDLEKNVKNLEKEIASIKKEQGLDEVDKLKEDNRILREALEDLKRRSDNEHYVKEELSNESYNELKPNGRTEGKDPEVLAREKANRDRIGRMIYGDAYDGTQTF